MSDPIKKCNNCQQDCSKENYHGKKEGQEFTFCTTCWTKEKKELKKIVLDEFPKLEFMPSIIDQSPDKIKFTHEKNNTIVAVSSCWGCGELYTENHNSPSCKEIGKERGRYWHLKWWKKGGVWTDENEKELKELEKRYGKSNKDDETRERERERAFWTISKSTISNLSN